MCHDTRLPTNFHSVLLDLDLQLIEAAREAGCPACGGVLHRADYPRKPWGISTRHRHYYTMRFSLCCTRDGCRRRVTPRSVRFLGRRRYSGYWVVLLTALSQGPSSRRARHLCRVLGLSARALTRWRSWWRERFGRSRCWREQRGHFLPAPRQLPADLLNRFTGTNRHRRLRQFLFWLASCGAPWLMGVALTQNPSLS